MSAVSRSTLALFRFLYLRSGNNLRLPFCRPISAQFHRCLTEQAFSRGPFLDSLSRDNRRTADQNARSLAAFPYAKDTLLYLATLLQGESGRNVLQLTIDMRKHVHGSTTTWESLVSISWPSSMVFYGKSTSKGEAARIACANACASLKTLGILDRNDKPVLYSWDSAENIKKKRYSPSKLNLPAKSVSRIEEWNRKFYEETLVMKENDAAMNFPVSDVRALLSEIEKQEELDIVSGDLKVSRSREELENRNDDMYTAHVRLKGSQDWRINGLLDLRKSLPVYAKREEILETIRENQVTLISGDTGSGKSTQVPQYLFESLIESNRGAEAQIIVTQPRRISAVSIAERVAFERNEELGKTVGYQVRLESTMPQESGCVFFCTTGILLRRLQDNPTLKGVTHVIVDEVHERDVLIDVLLSLLKNAVKSNPDVRVVLMSASMNSDLLSRYFDDCPIVQVEGYLHPVREYFLPDVCKFLGQNVPDIEKEDPKTSFHLLYDLIKYLDVTRPEGGILVFLPGWQEIKTMKNRILSTFYHPDRHLIFTLHSMVPLKEQHLVFEKLPPGQRKIVLATNIAETSITINDIRYVIDVGNQRGQSFNPERGITTLDTQWISQANAVQRRGRAGRVRSGECYRLYTKEKLASMPYFPVPEILRTSLEKVILDGKLFCSPGTKAVDFLGQLPQPPEFEGTQAAVEELIELGVLNGDETLTPLGVRVAHFTTHPRVSIALVYATFLRCLNPVLGIASFLSTNRDPFVNRLENKAFVKTVKENFAGGTNSDHIALANFLSAWSESTNDTDQMEEFCENYAASPEHLRFVDGIKLVLAEHLYEAFLVDSPDNATNSLFPVNENAKNTAFIKAALAAGVGNHILRASHGMVKKGKILKESVLTLPETDTLVEISRESVLSGGKEISEPWLIYHAKFKSGESRKTYVREVSTVPDLTLALFGGQGLELAERDEEDSEATLVFEGLEKVKFVANVDTANAVYELRRNIEDLVELSLKCGEKKSDELDALWDSLRDLLRDLLTV